jgi:nuclear GTP-binding protein
LKGGEPDQESVAKIILNDWIRGKIPYFAMPPDKQGSSGAANAEPEAEPTAEDKAVQEELAAREAELGKLLGEKKVKGVEQPLRSIITVSKFIGDDKRRIDDESEEDEVEGDGYDKSDDDMDGEAAEEQDEMAWDDLFPKAGSSKQPADGADSDDGGLDADLGDVEIPSDLEDDDEEEEEEEDEEDEVTPAVSEKQKGKRGTYTSVDLSYDGSLTTLPFSVAIDDPEEDSSRPSKTPRMTTNKQKSTNYYTTANVKNRNRDRKAPKNAPGGKGERQKVKDEGKKRMRRK